MIRVEDYIGRTDMDCWGLVRAVYQTVGVVLPTYGEFDHRVLEGVAAAVAADAGTPPWSAVSPFPGAETVLDVIVMTGWLKCLDGIKRRATVHCGVVPRPGFVLHTDMGNAVVEVPLDHFTVKGKLRGCYRHDLIGGRGAPA